MSSDRLAAIFFEHIQLCDVNWYTNINKEDIIMMPVRRPQQWLPSIFNDFFDNNLMTRANATAPAVNVIENENDYRVELAVPGMTKEIIIWLSQWRKSMITGRRRRRENI